MESDRDHAPIVATSERASAYMAKDQMDAKDQQPEEKHHAERWWINLCAHCLSCKHSEQRRARAKQ
jgi:hypothetical protein